MQRVVSRLGWIVALSAIAVPVFAAGEVTIALKPRPGTLRYHSEQTVNAQGMEVKVTRNYKTTVKSVKPTGEADIEEATENGQVTVMGQSMDLPVGGPASMTLDRLGKVVAFTPPAEGITTPEVARLMAEMGNVVFPAAAVAEGAEWTTEYVNPAVEGKKVQVKTKFLGMEKLDGKDAVKLKQGGAADVPDGKAVEGEATYWLDSATGAVLKYEVTVKGLPTMYGYLDIMGTVTSVPDTK